MPSINGGTEMEMGKMPFDVDSALLSELGERLVGSVHVAILELIKNAYDADATEVWISADRVPDGIVTVVEDNGSGMTFDQVQKYWMKIATTNKVKQSISEKYGRPKSGAKGIGRFSCRRLGTWLTLQTTAECASGKFQTTCLRINWKDFVAGTSLSQVEVEYNKHNSTTGKSGTILRITSPDTELLSEKSISYIKRHSTILVANRGIHRKGFEPDPGFNLSFRFFGEKEDGFSNLRDDLLNAGWGTVTAYVNAKGCAVLNLDAMGIGKTAFTSGAIFKHIVGAKLTVGVLVDDGGQIRDKKVLTLGAMRNLLDEWGGVMIRYNGVRVQPYGNPTDDWLNIDRDRGLRRRMSEQADIVKLARSFKDVSPERYMLQLLSSRSYVGDVEITSQLKGFVLKANREGFLSSTEFDELRLFARYAVDYVTLYRDRYLQEEKDRELQEKAKDFDAITKPDSTQKQDVTLNVESDRERNKRAIAYIRSGVGSLTNRISESRRKILVEGLSKATDVLEAWQAKNEEELGRLRLVASTSVLVALFSHDVKAYLVKMQQIESRLKCLAAEEKKNAPEINKIVQEIEEHEESFQNLIDMTLAVAAPGNTDTEERLLVLPRLKLVLSCFSAIMADYKVSCNIIGVPEMTYMGPMFKAELFSILVNVISNAIKAVVASGDARERKIECAAQEDGDRTILTIRDNGIGVDLAHSDQLFSPFVSDPAKNLYATLDQKINREHGFVLGTGSGLGLNIVKQIVESKGGQILFVKPSGGWRTELVIKM